MDEKILDIDISEEKYNDQSLRFVDKKTHYELIFADDFNMPSKEYTVVIDLMIDLKNADKNKELHIFINSNGGECATLTMLLQQILEFRHRVCIVTGSAMSCGFFLMCVGHEIYISPYSMTIYHAVSVETEGKSREVMMVGNAMEKINKEILRAIDVDRILTKDELQLGLSTEVYVSGRDLIERGAARDYSDYNNRKPLIRKIFFERGGRYFQYENGSYVEYQRTNNRFMPEQATAFDDEK